jgi:hypothetical protein
MRAVFCILTHLLIQQEISSPLLLILAPNTATGAGVLAIA